RIDRAENAIQLLPSPAAGRSQGSARRRRSDAASDRRFRGRGPLIADDSLAHLSTVVRAVPDAFHPAVPLFALVLDLRDSGVALDDSLGRRRLVSARLYAERAAGNGQRR